MFNLLPETEQQLLKSEHSRRKLVVILIFSFATLSIAVIFLAPSFFVSRYHLYELKQTATILQKNIAIANKESLNATVSVANKKIATIQQEPSQTYVALTNEITAAKSPDIQLNSFSIKQNMPTTTMSVKGTSKNRESLLDFANKLKQNPIFKKVDLPISNFAKESDIAFTLTLSARP